jgi:nitrate reductase alpha subunit
MDKLGNGGKGISWNTQNEVDFLGKLNYVKLDGPAKGRPRIETAIDASEVILALAPETNGQVAVKAWEALGELTGRDHTHLALNKEDEKIRFRDIQAQPRKIISSPTWSGLESEHVSYNAGYTNVHELIPWRTLSGRQQLYQDHPGCALSARAWWPIVRRLIPAASPICARSRRTASRKKRSTS